MSRPFLPYGCQQIDEEDIASVIAILRSDMITQGPVVQQFEEALATYCGAEYAVVVSSGTAGLHLACLAADIGLGDRVLTSPITFVASANCALYCGACPDFIDIDPQTYNLSAESLRLYLSNYSKEDRLRAVIPVHFAGQPCDMAQISKIAKQFNLVVIEDACHALGARWKDDKGDWQRIGSCSHSDMAVFSFHPVKHITTGEGGAILTNNKELYDRLCLLRTHGITKVPEYLTQNDGPWYYEMQDLGYNYRITDVQCALGISQLKKNDGWVVRRRNIAQQYDRAFADIKEVIRPYQSALAWSAYHLYVLQVETEETQIRKEIFESLRSEGIGTQVHYIPVTLQPYYQKQFGFSVGEFPHAERYYDRCFSLPIYPHMSDGDVARVIKTVSRIIDIKLRTA